MDVLLQALLSLLTVHHLMYLFLGVVMGLTVGILPGVGGLAGLAMVVPFIYGMDPGSAIAMMVGMTSVVNTSDTFPSVLMGVPGSSSAQATILDGFPLARQGQAARALSASFFASMAGGLFGAVILTGAIFIARPLILSIGFGEQLMLTFLALTMVGALTGPSVWKGLAACGVGLLLGSIGTTSVTAEQRLGLDILYLSDGIPIAVMGLAVFAIPEVIQLLRSQTTISESGKLESGGWLRGLRDVIQHRWIVVRSSMIGCIVGILPGLGGAVVNWITYGFVVQSTKDRENFGKGDIRGVIAPEAANNAQEGGSLIPTLIFGIPASATMAIFIAGMVIIGINPGPTLVTQHLDIAFLAVWSLAVANVMGTAICVLLAGNIAKLTAIRYQVIAPYIITIIFFAAYQSTRDWGDLYALILLGAASVLLKRFGWSRPALLMGFVMSPIVESGLYHTIQAYGMSFLERPLVIVIILVICLSVFGAVKARSGMDIGEPALESRENIVPQFVFFLCVAAVPLLAIADTYSRPFSASVFPISVAIFTLAMLAFTFIGAAADTKGGRKALYDADLAMEAGSRSSLRYISWIIGFLVLCHLVGFVGAMGVFVAAFLVVEAGKGYLHALIGGTIMSVLIYVVGDILALQYPSGLLQDSGVLSAIGF